MLAVPHPVFRRIRGGNAFEETVERLLQAVKLGQVRPGERLPSERELAQQFGVSRVTLREAIRALAQEGYFESRRGRSGGTFVLPTAAWRRDARDVRAIADDMGDELTDALLLRQVLEPGAVELAAQRDHPPEQVTALRGCWRRSVPSRSASTGRSIRACTWPWLDMAGSPSLSAAVADVRMRLNDLLDAIPLLPRNLEHSTEQHRRVVDAVSPDDRRRPGRRWRSTWRALPRCCVASSGDDRRGQDTGMTETSPESAASDGEVVDLCRDLIRLDTVELRRR